MNKWLLFLACSCLLRTGYGQTLTIAGAVSQSLTLKSDALTAMPHTTVTGKDHDGQSHRYSGVPVADLLKQAGVTLGNELRGKNLVKYAVVRASDGYEAVFALPELDPDFATRTIILADAVDGEPLTAATGPYRIVVPDEKKQARWVRQVQAIEICVAR
ncbi:molybdopterin-dependent oxidoreductase [Fibrella arboris]|uniref:molybdopterin-dependent oxidoreductase n=1 Tax=Fibrella arboris TaxID=3242486 RepID=UPI003520FA1C